MDGVGWLWLGVITSASSCRNSFPRLRTFLLANIDIMGQDYTANPLTGSRPEKNMKTWLMLLGLLFIPSACGGPGPVDSKSLATEDKARELASRHVDTGLVLHESGRALDAISEYDLALRLYPYHAEAYLNRGMAYALLDETQRAIQDYEQAARLDPNLPQAFAGWGRALIAMEEPEKAIRHFDEAVLLDPLDTESYLDRGDAYGDLGLHERMLDDYNEAVQIEPDKAEAYYQRGFDRAGLAEFELALEKLREVRR